MTAGALRWCGWGLRQRPQPSGQWKHRAWPAVPAEGQKLLVAQQPLQPQAVSVARSSPVLRGKGQWWLGLKGALLAIAQGLLMRTCVAVMLMLTQWSMQGIL